MTERRVDSDTAVQDQDQQDLQTDKTPGKQGATMSTADLATTTPRQNMTQGGMPAETARDAAQPGAAGAAAGQSGTTALFPPDETQTLRSRWDTIQTGFVDEPRRAVEQADALVAEAMKRLAEIFAQAREDLEGQWSRGDDVSTEDLRLALQRYRSFFDRLLSV